VHTTFDAYRLSWCRSVVGYDAVIQPDRHLLSNSGREAFQVQRARLQQQQQQQQQQ
jgi:hypothetical protein